MSKKKTAHLRAVAADEKAPRKTPKTIVEAVEMDERALLVALRKKAAAEIDGGVPAAYLAPVMRQVRELDKAIRALDGREKQDEKRNGPVEDTTFDITAI